MNIFVDVDSHQLIQSPGARSPAGTISIKSQDTPAVSIYFVSGGVVLDLGESPVLKFGLVAVTARTVFLSYDTVFTRGVDSAGLIRYTGFPVFNTSKMATALGGLSPLPCTLEIRYQLTDGEITHTLDASVLVYPTILVEGGTPATTVIEVYPDPAVLEVKTNKNQPSGYAALDSAGLLDPDVLPPNAGVNLTDFQTALGLSVINQAIGIFNRLIAGTGISFDSTTTPGAIIINSTLTSGGTTVALTDFETSVGASLIHDASGILNRLAAGVGITLDTGTTPGAIIINTTGVAALSDFETSTGTSLIHTVTGILQRLVAGTGITFDTTTTPGAIILNVAVDTDTGITSLTDFETSVGVSLIQNSSGILNRLFAGTGITFDTSTTPGAVIINASGGGGSLTLVDAETTAGDTLLGATNGEVKRLIAGTNVTLDPTTTPGGIIVSAAGGGAGATVFAQVRLNTSQNYADATNLAFDTVVSDATGMWNATNPDRLTIATAGIYHIHAALNLVWNESGGAGTTGIVGEVLIAIVKNVAAGFGPANGTIGVTVRCNAETFTSTQFEISGYMTLAIGDFVSIQGLTINNGPVQWKAQNNGGTSTGGNTGTAAPVPVFSILKVG